MATTGTNSENQDMRLVADEIEVKTSLTVGGGAISPPVAAGAIADLALTGTYTTDDDAIEAAVNGILAALRTNGIIAAS